MSDQLSEMKEAAARVAEDRAEFVSLDEREECQMVAKELQLVAAAIRDIQVPAPPDRESLLSAALCNILICANVIRSDVTPSGPELLLFAEEYADYLKSVS